MKNLLPLTWGLALLCLVSNVLAADAGTQQNFAGSGYNENGYTPPAPKVIRDTQLTLKTALEEIYKTRGILFIYNDKQIDGVQISRQSLSLETNPLIHAIDKALNSRQLRCSKISSKQYLIVSNSEKEAPETRIEVPKPRPDVVISGTVRDAIGNPLPGVTVRVSRTGKGMVTSTVGRYSVDAEPLDTLEFSFVGYKKQLQPVRNRLEMDVIMEAQEGGLNEVVVVGFGKQRKISLIGAQTGVKVEELKQPVRNLSTLLAGRLAGIVGVQRSGEPGYDDAEVWIRGISTFTNSRPLVLVDGIERPFSNIDPEDIESFNILKDASATAVYGVRGANGVIVITTKSGKAQKVQINADLNKGITQFTRLPKYADGVTYMKMANEANLTRGGTAQYSDEAIRKTASGEDPELYPNVNWINEIFRKHGSNKRANVNLRGGTDITNYYVSVSYYDEVGLFKRDDLARYNSDIKFTRYNFTSNLNMRVTKTTRLEFGVQGYIGNGNFPGTGTNTIFESAITLPPIVHPPKYSDGRIAGQRTGSVANPYDQLTQSGYVTEFRNQLFSNIRLRQDLDFIVKGLSFTSMFSFDTYNEHRMARTKTVDNWLATGRDANGQLIFDQTRIGTNYLSYSRSNGGNRQFYTETALNYDNAFGKHRVGGLLLYNQSDKIDAFKDDFIGSIPRRQRGLAGRATYSFDDRYLAEVNFGYNGSETFSPNRRYGFFPSAGLGWVVSGENFFKPLTNAVQFLKFRFSYGLVGNGEILDGDNVRRFAYIPIVASTNGYTFGKDRNNKFDGYDIGEYASDVTWETARKTNLGMEVTTLKGSLNLQVDLFKESRTGIFLRRSSIPAIIGLRSNPYGNLGKTENKGIDISVDYNRKIGEVQLALKGNFTFNRNKVIDDDLPPWAYPYLERKGRKIGQRFGYIAEGLFSDSAEILKSPVQNGNVRPGDIKFKDINGDGVINAYDQAPIGYGSIPEIVYGFGINAAWRNFAIGMFFQGISNVDIYTYGEGFVPFQQGGTRGNLMDVVTDRWTPDNPNPHPFYPRLSFGEVNDNYKASTWWIKNGRYLRLKNAEVSYTLPQHWLKRIGVQRSRIYMLGYNLLTFSPFKLWDVELGEGRGTKYPQLTTYTVGASFQF
ncbi:TonB-dependent receptor [Chitinophaga sp. 212800010-3]|uniref:SusC/RagA family TonB-linked outer membrane protein n=1 Tax=unclassified Chitinophaga TaxID=2619133 RepID=UPI002DEE0768|nr:TonB-linked outer membrane protein, SusC/RagA family [Chitinophaga sp. 212800010-3]